jgi:hypothetical protein
LRRGTTPENDRSRGEAPEAVRVAEAAEDLGGQHRGHAGRRQNDPVGVDGRVQVGDPVVEVMDLLSERQRQLRFDGDVGGEGVEIQTVRAPQGDGRLGRRDNGGSPFVAPGAAAGAAEPACQSAPPEPFDLVRVGPEGQERETPSWSSRCPGPGSIPARGARAARRGGASPWTAGARGSTAASPPA